MTQVLIVESNAQLAELWKQHLTRHGAMVCICLSEEHAITFLQEESVDVLIIDLELDAGHAFSIADFARFKQPEAQAIFVRKNSFFSDGSVFNLCANARAIVESDTPPEDIAAMVAHYVRKPIKPVSSRA